MFLFCSQESIGLKKKAGHIPNSDPSRIRIISDNPLYRPYEGGGEEINIIGRIRWFARDVMFERMRKRLIGRVVSVAKRLRAIR
jgi:hypothetical protein